MIIQRFEKGNKFLDLERYIARGLDDDGCLVEDECWDVVIYDNEYPNFNQHKTIEFANEVLAMMYIRNNQWKEQVL